MNKLAIALMFITGTGPAIAGGDPLAGKATAIICAGCHGRDGNSTNPIYPKLAGQGEPYLIKQLTDFKMGARKEEHMSSMVDAINKSDIPDLAAWFAQQKRTPALYNKTKAEPGKQIFHNGINAKGVTACDGCHGTDGKGNSAITFPALAGQHADYIIKTLNDFKHGTRLNDPGGMMRNNVINLSSEEIASIANYVAGMK